MNKYYLLFSEVIFLISSLLSYIIRLLLLLFRRTVFPDYRYQYEKCTVHTVLNITCINKNIYNITIPYEKALSWNELSEQYKKIQIKNKKLGMKNEFKSYVIPIQNNWSYSEDFQFYPYNHSIVFHQSNDHISNKSIICLFLNE